jgi:hypothetical protein
MPDEDTKTPAGFLDNTQAAALGDRLRRVNGRLLFWSTVAFAVAGVQVAGRAKGWTNGVSGLEVLNTPVFLSALDKLPFVRHLGFVKGTTDFMDRRRIFYGNWCYLAYRRDQTALGACSVVYDCAAKGGNETGVYGSSCKRNGKSAFCAAASHTGARTRTCS